MGDEEKIRLIQNLVRSIAPVEYEEIELRAVENFFKADPELGTGLAKGLGISLPAEI